MPSHARCSGRRAQVHRPTPPPHPTRRLTVKTHVCGCALCDLGDPAPRLLDRYLDKPPRASPSDPPESRSWGPAESHTSCATDMCVSVSSLVPPERVQVVDGTRTDDGIEFVDELFDQDGRVRFPGRRPGSIPRPTPPQLSLDRPDPHPPLAPRLPDRARVPGDFHHRPALKLVAVALPRAAGAAGARLVRDEQGEPAGAPLEPRSESQQL